MDASADRHVVVEAARGCRVLRHAQVLSEWVGNGRPVTAKGVLRRADVPPAGQALGIAVPGQVRSAADVPDLHRPWTAALELGLLAVSGGRATPGPTVTSWAPSGDEDVLECWSRALVAVLAEVFDAGVRAEAWELGRIALTVLTADPAPAGDELLDTIQHTALHTSEEVFELVLRGFGTRRPVAIVLEVLSAFGAVTADEHHPTITALGRWALAEISSRTTAASSGSPVESGPGADTVCQLAITLQRVRPSCWRRERRPGLPWRVGP